MKRYCVYTVLVGNYERLNEQPIAAGSGVDFICFTDERQLKSDTWTMRYMEPVFPLDLARSSRLYKICPHRFLQDYDASLYLDNSVILKQALEQMLPDLLEQPADVVCMNHSFRETVLDEFQEVVRLQLDNLNIVLEQLNAYHLLCPELLSQKPYWAGFLWRDHRSESAAAAMEIWLAQVLRYSRRDQLSLNYALAQRPVAVRGLDLDNYDSKYHSWPHADERKFDDARKMALLSTTSELLLRKMAEAELQQKISELDRKDRLLLEVSASRIWRFLQPFRRLWLHARSAKQE